MVNIANYDEQQETTGKEILCQLKMKVSQVFKYKISIAKICYSLSSLISKFLKHKWTAQIYSFPASLITWILTSHTQHISLAPYYSPLLFTPLKLSKSVFNVSYPDACYHIDLNRQSTLWLLYIKKDVAIIIVHIFKIIIKHFKLKIKHTP